MADRLTARDVESQEFPKKVRGYAPDEVRMYLRSIAEELKSLTLENLELHTEIEHLKERAADAERNERTLRETLVSAQQLTEEMKTRAREEAELTVREAKLRSERMLEQAQDQLARIEEEIRRARLERDAFESRLRSTLEEHVALLELRAKDRDDLENLAFMHRRTGSE